MSHPLLTAPIGSSLWRLAAPTTAVMMVQTVVAIAETYFFGRLGTDALAGFALVFPFMMLMQMMAAGGMGCPHKEDAAFFEDIALDGNPGWQQGGWNDDDDVFA